MIQEYDSAKTARKQVGALLKKGVQRGLLKPGTVNLDLGGGPWDLGTEFLAAHGVESHVIDPYNRDDLHNESVALFLGRRGGADTVTLSNVLNVISTQGARREALLTARSMLKPDGVILISVYEGDKSGDSCPTRDGWQEHRKLVEYGAEVAAAGFIVELRWGIMIARPV